MTEPLWRPTAERIAAANLTRFIGQLAGKGVAATDMASLHRWSIAAPEDQAKVTMDAVTIRGFAWAGEEKIERVEVSTDGGSKWRDAQLSSQKLPFAWRLWQIEWRPAKPGYYTILSRATDSAGRVQPFVPAWNPSGYLWNGIDRVGVTVEAA